jgi:predicted nucleotidyltransferase
MNLHELLSTRLRERSELLDRIVAILSADPNVRAAWLSGSVSRGDDDALSDRDLSVVVSDESIGERVDRRRTYAARSAPPVLLMDNLSNAPVDGAYLLAFYPGEAGPQHVDWFWQPESGARIPDDEKVLFNNTGLPLMSGDDWRRQSNRPPGAPLAANAPLGEQLTHKITFFWAMSIIAAKYIARRDGETFARMTSLIAHTLSETAQLGEAGQLNLGADDASVASLASSGSRKQF